MYPNEQRKPFRYFNGTEVVHGDPLALYRKILAKTGGDPGKLSTLAFKDPAACSPEELAASAQAMDALIAIVREVFAMAKYEPKTDTGALDEHCITAWRDLAGWLHMQKKTFESLQTGSPLTDGHPDLQTITTSTSA